MNKNKLSRKVSNYIKNIEPRLIKIRRDIHKHPEVAFEEYRTSEKIEEYLKDLDIEIKTGIGGTGITGLFSGNKNNSTIALRADMDALNLQEKNNKPYSSINKGIMHACGHDGHIAILLGVAEVLNEIKEELPGNVKLIFQPAEEGIGGAQPMIKEGVLKEPQIDAIFGLHIWLDLPSGTIGLKKGPAFAAIDEFDVNVKGESAHGASPHQGIDAITVSSSIIQSLQKIISREIAPLDSGVISIGKIEGGTKRNVIAENVKMEGTVRYLKKEMGELISEKVENIVSSQCKAFGAEYKLDYYKNFPVLKNSESLFSMVKKSAIETVGENAVQILDNPTMGGEDFAYFTQQVPGFFFFLGGRNEKKGITVPHHNPYFDFDEDIIIKGVEAFVNIILNYFSPYD